MNWFANDIWFVTQQKEDVMLYIAIFPLTSVKPRELPLP